jgi:tetratricopeptide (TPR) repeat protein
MSLLLDALKRAEDAKRAKAEAAASSQSEQATPTDASTEDVTQSPEPTPTATESADVPLLSLEVDDDRPGESIDASRLSVLAAEVSPPDPAPPAAPLSLEDMLDNELGYSDRKKPEPLPPTPAATAAFRAARLQSAPPAPPTPPPTYSASFSAPPSLLELESTAATVEVAPPPSIPAPNLESNREAIKNAFAVKQTAKSPTKAKWLLPVIAVLIVAVGSGGWYVWTEMNRFNKPTVAFVPRPAAPAAPPSTPPATASAPTTPATATSTPPAQSDKPTGPATDAKAAPKPAEDAPAPLPPLLPPPATQLKEERKAVAQAPVPATPREAIARRIDALPPLAGAEIGADRVLLKPSTAAAQTVSPVLSAGYAALSAGDYATAKRRYAEAIAANNNSTDAHLGFATAAARSGDANDLPLAIKHYQRVLELDPRNSTASAALIVLTGGRAAANSGTSTFAEKEAELKLLITQDPSSPNAHYLLGTLYAEQRRWRDAQQSFFEAARLAPQVADYSYNLAVSLDNLGQGASAASFYRRALSATTKGQFDAAAVQRRISQLTETNSAASR